MERVTGIGGVFFRAGKPEGLPLWYQERLGVTTVPESYGGTPWRQQEGGTGVAPLPQAGEVTAPPEHLWMINFRGDALDAIVAQLRPGGKTVDVDPARYPNGRFAELRAPEGNGVQLWQPMAPE